VTLVDDLQDVVDDGRRLAQSFGLRPRIVEIVEETTAAPDDLSEIAVGGVYDEDTRVTLDPAPKIRSAPQLRSADGGVVETGRLIADRISVKDYTREDLERDGRAIWLIDGLEYVPVAFERRAFKWIVTLDRKVRGR
jgi:hypothetical protein